MPPLPPPPIRIPLTENSLKIKKGLELVSSLETIFLVEFFDKKILIDNITLTCQISLPACIYFPRYSVVLCFMFKHLMTS